jgi:hypothetical protein
MQLARLHDAARLHDTAFAAWRQVETAVAVQRHEARVAQAGDVIDGVGRNPAEAEDSGVKEQVELRSGRIVMHGSAEVNE